MTPHSTAPSEPCPVAPWVAPTQWARSAHPRCETRRTVGWKTKKSKTKSNTWQKISKGHRRVTGRAVGVRDPRERGWQQYFCLAHWEGIFVFAKKEIAVNMYRYRTLLSFIANFIRIFSLRCYGNETLPTSFHLRIDGNSFPELKNDKWKNEICDGNPRG